MLHDLAANRSHLLDTGLYQQGSVKWRHCGSDHGGRPIRKTDPLGRLGRHAGNKAQTCVYGMLKAEMYN